MKKDFSRALKNAQHNLFLLVSGMVVLFSAGCVSPYQVAMERAMYAREYRELQDHYYELDHRFQALAYENRLLKGQSGENDAVPLSRPKRPKKAASQPDSEIPPLIPPISTEGMRSSETIPDALSRPGSGPSHLHSVPGSPTSPPPIPNGQPGARIPIKRRNAAPSFEQETFLARREYTEANSPEMIARPSRPAGTVSQERMSAFPDWSPNR